MIILDDLLSTVDLSPAVRDIRQGLFQTAVLADNCGLAASLSRDALRGTQTLVKEPGTLLEKSTEELARMVYSESLLEAAIGMATLNSLLDIDESICQELNARDLIAEKGSGKNVAIIGHFPFIPYLKKTVKSLWVIEKNPKEGDFTETQGKELIPQAHVVGITGTAFSNHTIGEVLDLCSPDAFVVVLGATAPLSPVLFDYGINAVSGTKVLDAETAMRCVSQGATYRQIRGIRQLTMLKG